MPGSLLFAYEVRRRNLRDDRLWVIAGMSLALAAIASRMGTWWQQFDPTQNEPLLQWWSDGNRSVLAALVGAWIGVHLGKLMTGYKPSTGDLFAPSVALAMAIGRIGCLLTELPGHPDGRTLGHRASPPNRPPSSAVRQGVGLHPTFAYEIVFQAIAFVWLWRHRDRLPRPGDLFIAYVAAYALFRFGVEFFRANEQVWFGLTRPQWFLLCTLPLLAWRVSRIWRPRTRARRRSPCDHRRPP